jgi:hypothetical protein
LHLYVQPEDVGFLDRQHAYGREHHSFRVHKLTARSHFPMFEVPETMAQLIGEFATRA